MQNLVLRRRTSRLWDKMGIRPVERGASLLATPYSSVVGHHVFGAKSDSAGWTWCFAPPNALFFRRRAPRLRVKMGLRRVGRGASRPATPCSFVAGHHVFGAKWGFGRLGVVLRSPQCLVLSSTGTTSLEQNRIRPVERGASLPAMPCSFVAGHHVSMRTQMKNMHPGKNLSSSLR